MNPDGKQILLTTGLFLFVFGGWYFLFPDILVLQILAIFFAVFFLFSLYFFRDPKREIVAKNEQILSPADGKIVKIEMVKNDFIGEEAVCISIFLSIFNVHVNRMAISGTVEYINEIPGKFYGAYRTKASEQNSRVEVGVTSNKYRVIITQITGVIARRINCYLKQNQTIFAGEKYGSIQFGSRVDILFPARAIIHAKVGDEVRGGISVLGEIR